MKDKNNLTKENFWNELYAQYPEAVQQFCDWIDQYKTENNWVQLFNSGAVMAKSSHGVFEPSHYTTSAPKFHDLPLAMQTGIWIQFVQERGGCSWEVDLFEFDLREEITEFMKMVQESQIK